MAALSETIHLLDSDLILNVYKAVIDGSLTKYPKEFFSGTSGHARAIVCRDLFDSPVDMLHESLSKDQRDDFLYHYARFLYDRTVYKRTASHSITDYPSDSGYDTITGSLSLFPASSPA